MKFLRKHFLGLLLLAGLAASLWLNWWLAMKVFDYKGQLFLSKQFPDASGQLVKPDGRKLVWMTGDSRIGGWNFPDTPSRQVVNRGVSGFTARQSLDQFRADLASGSKPDIVVIQLGINDIMSAGYNRPAWLTSASRNNWKTRPTPEQITSQCASDIGKLVETATAAGAEVVLLTAFPPGPLDLRAKIFWSDELDGLLTKLNEKIRGMTGPGVALLDAAKVLSDAGRTRKVYAADVLHLNPAGYEVLSAQLEFILQPLLKPQA